MSNLTLEEIAKRALALPENERLELAGQLLASVPPPPGVLSMDDPLAMEEIMRRSDAIHAGTAELIDGEEVIKMLRDVVARAKEQKS